MISGPPAACCCSPGVSSLPAWFSLLSSADSLSICSSAVLSSSSAYTYAGLSAHPVRISSARIKACIFFIVTLSATIVCYKYRTIPLKIYLKIAAVQPESKLLYQPCPKPCLKCYLRLTFREGRRILKRGRINSKEWNSIRILMRRSQ